MKQCNQNVILLICVISSHCLCIFEQHVSLLRKGFKAEDALGVNCNQVRNLKSANKPVILAFNPNKWVGQWEVAISL